MYMLNMREADFRCVLGLSCSSISRCMLSLCSLAVSRICWLACWLERPAAACGHRCEFCYWRRHFATADAAAFFCFRLCVCVLYTVRSPPRRCSCQTTAGRTSWRGHRTGTFSPYRPSREHCTRAHTLLIYLYKHVSFPFPFAMASASLPSPLVRTLHISVYPLPLLLLCTSLPCRLYRHCDLAVSPWRCLYYAQVPDESAVPLRGLGHQGARGRKTPFHITQR